MPASRRTETKIMNARTATVAALLLAVGVSGCGSTAPSPQATSPAPTSRQTVLPFAGLEGPHDVSVDATGSVYVDDTHTFKGDKGFPDATSRLLQLVAGSNTQIELPFRHSDLVVDPAGVAYVFDYAHDRMVKLASGSGTQTEVAVPGLGMHGRVVAVDTAGNLYDVEGGGVIAGGGCCAAVQVVKLAAGTNTRTVLPFTGLFGPDNAAVDAAGDVFIVDDNRVLKLAAGSATHTVLPFTGLKGIVDVAVDKAGNVYVTDAGADRVVELAAGSVTQTVVPIAGLYHPVGVGVDTAGNVYVVDGGNKRVVKLAAA
jgi:streptogramin lyase